jgi:hypothetical protein
LLVTPSWGLSIGAGGIFETGGRVGRVLVAVRPAGGAPAGLGAGRLFGRTNGSAAFGRRILIGGAPFDPVGVRAFMGFVGVDIFPVELCQHGCRR